MSEKRGDSSPEYFGIAESLPEVISRYQQLSELIVDGHGERFRVVGERHEQVFLTESRSPGTIDVDQVMAATAREVGQAVLPIGAQFEGLAQAVSGAIRGRFSHYDAQIMRQVDRQANVYGVGSFYVDEAIGMAGTAQARQAMKVALDVDVFARVRKMANVYGVGSFYVDESIEMASSHTAKQAMKASLDDTAYKHCLKQIRTFGLGSFYAKEALKNASTAEVRKAFMAAIDEQVLAQARREAKLYGVDTHYVERVLNESSTTTVRGVLARVVGNEFRRQKQPGSDYGFDEEEIFVGYYRRTRGSSAGGSGRREQPGRPQAETRGPDPDAEVAAVVAKVISSNRQYSWLKSENLKDVRRVINTVRAAREKAAKTGEELTDREIYLRYRRKADRGEAAGKDIADPVIVKSFKILDAMMGGNLRGKLPF